jgi:thioredoxin 1
MTEITETDFKKEVLESELPVLACFTARWCQTCFPTCLLADELEKYYEGDVKFVKLDVEKSNGIVEKYHIVAVPTILIFKDSQLAKRLLGFQRQRPLRTLINSLIEKAADSPAESWK